MLGGGRVRRVSLGSVMQQSPCARAEKKGGKKKRPAMPKTSILPKPEPIESVTEAETTEEEGVSPAKSIIITKPSIASVTSTKFGGERMIQARKGLLERQSLEESCLIADGEELASFGMFPLKLSFHVLTAWQPRRFRSLVRGLVTLDVHVRARVLPLAPDPKHRHCPLMHLPPAGLSLASTLANSATCYPTSLIR